MIILIKINYISDKNKASKDSLNEKIKVFVKSDKVTAENVDFSPIINEMSSMKIGEDLTLIVFNGGYHKNLRDKVKKSFKNTNCLNMRIIHEINHL